jgi:outer membrane protein assembly factor BamA
MYKFFILYSIHIKLFIKSNIKALFVAAAVLFLYTPIAAQETEIVVDRVVIEVTNGNTREAAVRRWIKVTEGMSFSSDEELKAVVDRDVQELVNLRVFLSVKTAINDVEVDGELLVGKRQVVFFIEDATTFIPIPLPLYDSNTGGLQLLYVQIWDNMFGTLTDWFSLATITLRRDDDGKIETGPWLFAPQVSNIKAGNFVFGVRFEQERVETQTYSDNNLETDYRYDRSALFVNTEIRTGERRRLYYTIEPGVDFRYGYTDFLGSGGFAEQPFLTQLDQTFYYDSVDVYFNSRKGIRAGLGNITGVVLEDGDWKPKTEFNGEVAPYFAFGKNGFFSYYARFMGMTIIGGTKEDLGEPLRGIPDATMDGDTAFYLNQTLGISAWRWKGVWDLQFHPFFDIGLALGGTDPFKGWQDVKTSTGVDILLFIEKVPNLAFRFSWGVDLDPAIPWGDDNKTEFIVRYAYSY